MSVTKLSRKSGDDNIDGLIYGVAWANRSRRNPITFGFTSSIDDYNDDYFNKDKYGDTYEAFFWDQRIVATEWFQNLANVANIYFKAINGKKATIRIAMSDYSSIEKNNANFAHAFLPSEDLSGGDAWFNRTGFNDLVNDTGDVIIGTKAYYSLGHELAHALGLKHGHEKGGIADVAMTSERDSMEFSIMTYRSYVGSPLASDTVGYQNEKGGFAQSLMMYDIAALQYIYGAKFSSENHTFYEFSESTGEMFINGISQGAPKSNRIFRTIWDDGGYDTYEFDNYKTNLSIDMNPGGWIDLDVGGNSQRARLGRKKYARAHIFNALEYNGDSRSLIEDVNSGTGNDYIKGNRINNNISGGNGNDTIYGQDGADRLWGGNGNDVLYGDNGDDWIFGDSGNDKLYGGNGADELSGYAGNDKLYGGNGDDMLSGGNGKDFIHGDDGEDQIDGDADNDKIYGGNGDDRLSGGNGNDFIQGDDGDDIIDGGAGNDELYGGNGHDWLLGGNGNDILLGGSGIDQFFGGPGVDIINAGGGYREYLVISHRGRSHYDIITGLAISVQGFVDATFLLQDQLDDGLIGEIRNGIGIKGLAFDYGNRLVRDRLFVGPGNRGDLKGSPSGIYVNTNTGLIYYNDSKDRGSHLLAKVELGIAQALGFENFYYE